MLNVRPMNVNGARPKLHRFPARDSNEEIIGDTGCELRTRQLPLDRFAARNEMGSL